MKIVISERQYKLFNEQVLLGSGLGLLPTTTKIVKKYPHEFLAITGIASAFIPLIGPFISVGIGFLDAALYAQEGDSTSAKLAAAFSIIPGLAIANKIPGVKQLGSKGMALLAEKIGRGANLTKAELEIAEAIKNFTPKIQDELIQMGSKLKNVIDDVQKYKVDFIKKYGESEYNKLLAKYLYEGIDQSTFLSKLKNVKAPNIKVKSTLGGGADHRIFQSAVNPNQIIKAEVRPGEIDKWYDLFQKNPKIFANTIKKTSVTSPNGGKLAAVVMEKLNTGAFVKFWDEMETVLTGIQKNLPFVDQVSLEYLLKNKNKIPRLQKVWTNMLTKVRTQYPDMAPKLDQFSKLVDDLYEIVPNPDIRQFNFGYDTKGLLKALDI